MEFIMGKLVFQRNAAGSYGTNFASDYADLK
jgi:hypothetical protein